MATWSRMVTDGHGWARIMTTRDHPDSIHLFSKEKRKGSRNSEKTAQNRLIQC